MMMQTMPLRVNAPFALFKNKNYRYYFTGQFITLSGNWMQSVAQAWLVYNITNSAFWLGAVSFANQIPAFLMSPYAGVIADRKNRRKIIIITETLSMLQSFVLAALVFAHAVQLWHIIVLTVMLGVVNAFEMVARHAFAVDIVGKNDLSHAIALHSVMMNGSRIIGPAFAGAILAATGEGACFLLCGLSCIPVIFWMSRMKNVGASQSHHGGSVLGHIQEGLSYAGKHGLIWKILLLSAFVCLVSTPYTSLLPVFAKNVLSGGANTLAWLTGMLGVGAVTGAFFFSQSKDNATLKKHLIRDVLLWGCGLIAFGLSKHLLLSLVAMFMVGFYMMNLFPTMNNAIQHFVDDRMRGRVMGLYTMTFLGTMPFGCLIMGNLSDSYGAPVVVTGAGVLTFAMGAFLFVRDVRLRKRKLAAVELPG